MNKASPEGKTENSGLLTLLDALVGYRGRVGAAEVLGVNYRTLRRAQDTRKLSAGMVRALEKFATMDTEFNSTFYASDPVGEEEELDPTLASQMNAIRAENRELCEIIESLTVHLQELWRRVALLEGGKRHSGHRNSRRGEEGGVASGVPCRLDNKVVAIVPRHKEESVLGTAAPLVAEWRKLRARATKSVNPLALADDRVQLLELELRIIEEFELTLPPDVDPWDHEVRSSQAYSKRSELPGARRDLERAKKRDQKDGNGTATRV